MFRATTKFDPETIAQVGNGFWHKWQETVTDMADTARQSVGAKSMADILTAQIGFGVRNAERWTQWSSPEADIAAAMEPEPEDEPGVVAEPEAETTTATIAPADDGEEVTADAAETATVEPMPAPASVETPSTDVTPAPPAADDLTRIRGIGPAIERKLHARGVTSFRQIADLSGDELTALDDALDFRGRIERDEWVAQAQKLARR